MTSRQPGWYVVQAQPNAENKAVVHLERQGFASLFAALFETQAASPARRRRSATFFPRYLFVEIDLATQRWRSIHSTVGVSQLVCAGDVPTPVPDYVVASLKDREDTQGFIRLARQPLFRRGDRIRVRDGLFSDCLGLYDGMPDRDRVAVLLDLLGRKVRVLLDAEAVTAA